MGEKHTIRPFTSGKNKQAGSGPARERRKKERAQETEGNKENQSVSQSI